MLFDDLVQGAMQKGSSPGGLTKPPEGVQPVLASYSTDFDDIGRYPRELVTLYAPLNGHSVNF